MMHLIYPPPPLLYPLYTSSSLPPPSLPPPFLHPLFSSPSSLPPLLLLLLSTSPSPTPPRMLLLSSYPSLTPFLSSSLSPPPSFILSFCSSSYPPIPILPSLLLPLNLFSLIPMPVLLKSKLRQRGTFKFQPVFFLHVTKLFSCLTLSLTIDSRTV